MSHTGSGGNTNDLRDAQQRAVMPVTALPAPIAAVARPLELALKLANTELDALLPAHSRIQVQLLANRGIRGAEQIATFLNADWRASGDPLPDLDTAVARIQRALRDHEQIAVFGDYDCDGMTSCALLTAALRDLGAASVTPYVPVREDDGRGLNPSAIAELAAKGIKLLITTDCGTANIAEVQQARDLGMEVIITDHHPAHGPLPDGIAVVNPSRMQPRSTAADLAGVGVAFRLAEALYSHLDTPDRDAKLDALLDLVAVGTIADVVPLTAQNWALVRAGLRRLRAAPRPGLRALLAAARLRPEDASTRDISFSLAPRLNACGRLGQPKLALNLLLAASDTEATDLAAKVEALNAERQTLTEAITAEARAQLLSHARLPTTPEPDTLSALAAHLPAGVGVAIGNDWHMGMLGPVAGRLAEDQHRPIFILSQGETETRGSARGPEGNDLGALLAANSGLFKRFGGHTRAAGFTLANEQVAAFLRYLGERFAAHPAASADSKDDSASTSQPALAVDAELPIANAIGLYDDIAVLAPFGPDFPEPVFVTRQVKIVGCRAVGNAGVHLRLSLREKGRNFAALWPRQGALAGAMSQALPALPPVDLVYRLGASTARFGGEREVQPYIVGIGIPS
ncbi:MAG: Single-stranded-DNA-specific exonuclease RecJ [Ktedonobacterales bacterium]|jgi:single-stranded-DNA-specific exonuclease|nr:MAG: Single-stranded-DNA-specific exonuclease RecJ [Ktedonobacterales bacterium]